MVYSIQTKFEFQWYICNNITARNLLNITNISLDHLNLFCAVLMNSLHASLNLISMTWRLKIPYICNSAIWLFIGKLCVRINEPLRPLKLIMDSNETRNPQISAKLCEKQNLINQIKTDEILIPNGSDDSFFLHIIWKPVCRRYIGIEILVSLVS